MHGDKNRCRVVLPFQRELAGGAAKVGECVFQILNQGQGLAHLHLHPAQILGGVVRQAPLAGLLVDNQNPVVGVGDVDKEGVVTLGNGQAVNGEVGFGMQLGGGIGACAPDRVLGIVADEAVLGEDVAFAALDLGRAVGRSEERRGGEECRYRWV